MTEEITDINWKTSGRYLVITQNGTKHHINFDNQTLIREGAPGHEWSDKAWAINPNAVLSGSQPKVAVSQVAITPDGTPFHWTRISGLEVGLCLYASSVDGEWRQSSTIVSIEKEVDEPHTSPET